jgi:hypothetical protein
MYKGEVKDLREMVAWLNCELEKTKLPSNHIEIKRDAKLAEIMKTGDFIPAIKQYRTETNSSLKDAVDYCRALRVRVIRGEYGPCDLERIDPDGYVRRNYM